MSASSSKTRLIVESTASSPTPARRRHIPASIPKSQAYYWKHEWQAGEQETLGELAAGKGVTFQGARDAIRWLLSEDE
jgi:hypothetical protein